MSLGPAHAQAEQFVRYEAEQNRRSLERTANRLRREELIVEATVQTGYPAHEAILRQASLGKADLVVIEARRHRFFARLLLTQTDFELIRHCPVPLLIVKGRAAWRRPRILAALDPFHANDKPSKLDDTIVERARSPISCTARCMRRMSTVRTSGRLWRAGRRGGVRRGSGAGESV